MQKIIFFLLFLGAWGSKSHATTFNFPCNNPSTRDVRDVYLGFKVKDGASTTEVTINLCDQTVFHNEVFFKFPDFSALLANGFTEVRLLIEQPFMSTISLTAISNGTVAHSFPLNTSGVPVTFTLRLDVFPHNSPGFQSNAQVFTINPNFSASGAAFSPPSLVKHITFPGTVAPPVTGAFPGTTNVYNGNTVGSVDAYIQYAPAHNGKMIKPLIFVDGIDFDEKVYTYNGQTVRHGSTGWDIFQIGNEAADVNGFDPDLPVYRNYPASLNTLQASPNDYDIVFVDFERGSDWIQKNGELLIALIEWVNGEKERNRQAGLCPFDNVVVGASMGGQVARWALATMENRGLAHQSHTYVSYDSPQKGANIPLSIQAFAFLADRAGPTIPACGKGSTTRLPDKC